MPTKNCMNPRKTGAVAAGLLAALATMIPVATASAATPAQPLTLPALPAALRLPTAWGAGALPAFAPLPAFSPALTFVGPAVAIGPTVIGSVFNGGTSVVVSNNPPVNSGNVIASP
jgi:hypothetical protein